MYKFLQDLLLPTYLPWWTTISAPT
jgi:hypothetical protein